MQTLEQLREEVKKVDAEIIRQLGIREQLAVQIGILKAQHGHAVTDLNYEEKLHAFHDYHCEQAQLSKTFVKQLFAMIMAHSKTRQV